MDKRSELLLVIIVLLLSSCSSVIIQRHGDDGLELFINEIHCWVNLMPLWIKLISTCRSRTGSEVMVFGSGSGALITNSSDFSAACTFIKLKISAMKLSNFMVEKLYSSLPTAIFDKSSTLFNKPNKC